MKLCVLNKFDPKKHLKLEPYPYLVINEVLDEKIYEELQSSYPSMTTVAKLHLFNKDSKLDNNKRYQVNIRDALEAKESIPQIWREFAQYHSSEEFYFKVMDIFGPYLKRKVPDFKFRKKPRFSRFDIGLRDPVNPKHDIELDCQIGINSPVTETSSVIGPHVDNRREIYAGLFYLREKDDDSEGGSLNIYSLKKIIKEIEKGVSYSPDLFRVEDTIKYQRNTLAMLLCTELSFHGVTPRYPTPYPRRLVNMIAEVSKRAYWYKKGILKGN